MSAATPLGYEHHALSVTFIRRWFAVFVRMLWKEFWVVSPFLLVVAATMAGLAAPLVWVMRDQMHDAWGALYAIVILFPLLFALGCGGMSYAGEREDGTWDWLRRIAAPPSAVCAAKIFVGLICSLLGGEERRDVPPRFNNLASPVTATNDPYSNWRITTTSGRGKRHLVWFAGLNYHRAAGFGSR